MAQADLLETGVVTSVAPTAAISEQLGLEDAVPVDDTSDAISLSPEPMTE
jgi:hypothetical protein